MKKKSLDLRIPKQIICSTTVSKDGKNLQLKCAQTITTFFCSFDECSDMSCVGLFCGYVFGNVLRIWVALGSHRDWMSGYGINIRRPISWKASLAKTIKKHKTMFVQPSKSFPGWRKSDRDRSPIWFLSFPVSEESVPLCDPILWIPSHSQTPASTYPPAPNCHCSFIT